VQPDLRERLGRLVHETRLACEAERAEAEGRARFTLGTWEERTPHQRELDMRIGEAVALAAAGRDDAAADQALRDRMAAMEETIRASERERMAARMDELAANYPEDVFTPDSGTRDAIGGTAMRHAYGNAAREIREDARG
jgi:hypothetical protein